MVRGNTHSVECDFQQYPTKPIQPQRLIAAFLAPFRNEKKYNGVPIHSPR
jgi:hypothetical protein